MIKFLFLLAAVQLQNSLITAFQIRSSLTKPRLNLRMSKDEYIIAILGYLPFDPRFMDEGQQFMKDKIERIVKDGQQIYHTSMRTSPETTWNMD